MSEFILKLSGRRKRKQKNDFGIQIIIESSRLTSESDDGNNTAILINADGTVDIRSSEITGGQTGAYGAVGKVNAYESVFKVTAGIIPREEAKTTSRKNVGRATMITQKRLETFKIKYMIKNIQPENFVSGCNLTNL